MIPLPFLLKSFGGMNLLIQEILNIFLISWKERDPSEHPLALSCSLSVSLFQPHLEIQIKWFGERKKK